MPIPIIDRSKLMRTLWARNWSDTAVEKIAKVIGNTRIESGHEAAEAKAKEIRELIESGLSEAELLKKLEEK